MRLIGFGHRTQARGQRQSIDSVEPNQYMDREGLIFLWAEAVKFSFLL
jgi:hypothetical protein